MVVITMKSQPVIAACDAYRSVHRMFRALRGKELWQRAQIRCETAWLGNPGARWCVCPQGLSAESVVYSAGVGEEISFDLGLIERFGMRIHAFDPTPRSIAWVRDQALPKEFVFHPYGIAELDGRCRFNPPRDPLHVSHTVLQRAGSGPATELPVHRLETILRMLGHRQIDLLKMDIEGAEYGVLADLLAGRVAVKQLLVEFHHRWPEVGIAKTKHAIGMLQEAGYRVFSVSPSGEEYGFKMVVGR
jgi:FkbM family methyltransferase